MTSRPPAAVPIAEAPPTEASGPRLAPARPVPLDRRRYLRVVRFLAGVFAHLVVWDVAVRRVWSPLARGSADRRWRGLARRYRALAVSQGGLLIKMGQFMSIRVDVLPAAVTTELSGLQDEVPPEPFEALRGVIEESFGAPLGDVFAGVETAPLGAASLAQVHRARLPDGRAVVVKVQRPRIARLVETDLAAFRFGVRLLRRLGWIRRRADLDRLYDEFARTTRAELDFVAEGHHAETFARLFAGDPTVDVPSVYWTHTRERVLTLAEVTGIKISDLPALEAAGVDRRAVASKLVDTYFQQVFVHNFVHADPHPGNLFVVPAAHAPGAPIDASTSFRLAFVDFGMVAVVPERVRAHLREVLIGLATRDPARIVRAYDGAGLFLPGADLRRIEQAQAVLFDRFWGVRMGALQQLALSEVRALMSEFADLLREMPFQLPADLLFVGRAVGILSGLATSLDPEFDLWAALAPFARQLAGGPAPDAEEDRTRHLPFIEGWQALEARLRALAGATGMLEAPAQALLAIPGGVERVLREAGTGQLTLRHELGPDLEGEVQRWRNLARNLAWSVVIAGVLVAGAIVRAAEGAGSVSNLMLVGGGLALVVLLLRRDSAHR
jgi:predicted unusual protein kinase regulating ubiquinone biosynthesis (AarF/ABC1/UbiB family)